VTIRHDDYERQHALDLAIVEAPCSTCGAKGAEPCVTTRGSRRGGYTAPHIARLHAAHVAIGSEPR
jgi:hypothetical protein